MPIDGSFFSEINSSGFVFLREISDTQRGTLRVVIEQAEADKESSFQDIGGTRISGLHRVRPTEESHTYALVWGHYVIYAVSNESFAAAEASAIYSGRCLRVYTKSHFLDYRNAATIASTKYPGPMQHIGLLTESHVIDVISTVDPQVLRLK
jgi:hypothetical protein